MPPVLSCWMGASTASEREYCCHVAGLAWYTNAFSLRIAFSPFGHVLNSKVIIDRWTGRSRGFGFVKFSSELSMRIAISGMNGRTLDGRTIRVSEARPRQRYHNPPASVSNSNNGKQICLTEATPGTVSGADSDDDCVVLEVDPFRKLVATKKEKSDDDLLIIEEKGEVACRDFPHPRHSCARFPFSSMPHYEYCSKCYCYVCDSPAPCKYWFLGISSTGHCHATDKDIEWKIMRDSFKQNNQPSTSQNVESQTWAALSARLNSISLSSRTSFLTPGRAIQTGGTQNVVPSTALHFVHPETLM